MAGELSDNPYLITGPALISYSAGLPMVVIRVLPDPDIQEAILNAATSFEVKVQQTVESYHAAIKARRYLATERRLEREMMI